ncbi:MAG: redoxin domain-containing protein [Kiritimatiellae bacterium]|nr:redoxin domain-containing protein [Kiritimatiellia bacterium]
MFVVSALGAISARAAGEGDSAPDFRAPSTAGGDQALADFSGKWLVLYFLSQVLHPWLHNRSVYAARRLRRYFENRRTNCGRERGLNRDADQV